MKRILLVTTAAALASMGFAAQAGPGHGGGHAGGAVGMHGPNAHASARGMEVHRSLDAGVRPGRAYGREAGDDRMRGPNEHASDRAFEVHRMLDQGVTPGHAYGRTDASTRGRAAMDDHRSPRAKANTRVRGSSDVLGANTHASARGVERGSLSSTRSDKAQAKAKVRTKPD